MATAASQAAATACASAIAEEVAVEPAGVAQLPTLLANGCSCVVSLLPTATCTRVGGRRRRKQQRRWRERRQRRRQLTMRAPSLGPGVSRTLAGARGPPSRATDPGNIMQAHTLTQVGRRKRARAPFVAPSSRAGREQVETANRTESSQGGSRAGNSSTSSGPGGSWLHCTLWGDALRPAVRDRLMRTLHQT